MRKMDVPAKMQCRKSIYLSFSPATPAKCKLAICEGEKKGRGCYPAWLGDPNPKKLFKKQHHSNLYLLISSNLNFLAAGASWGDSSTRTARFGFHVLRAQPNFLTEKNLYRLLPTSTRASKENHNSLFFKFHMQYGYACSCHLSLIPLQPQNNP